MERNWQKLWRENIEKLGAFKQWKPNMTYGLSLGQNKGTLSKKIKILKSKDLNPGAELPVRADFIE